MQGINYMYHTVRSVLVVECIRMYQKWQFPIPTHRDVWSTCLIVSFGWRIHTHKNMVSNAHQWVCTPMVYYHTMQAGECYAHLTQELVYVNTESADCPFYNHTRSEAGTDLSGHRFYSISWSQSYYGDRMYGMASQRNVDDCFCSESDSDDEPAPPRPKRRYRLLYCGYCASHVSKATFFRHREKYFNVLTKQWQPKNECCREFESTIYWLLWFTIQKLFLV